MSDPAKIHNLSLKLAEARREVIRSRTVVRITRSVYRLDELGTSIETIPARFLMLVVDNMICDCAAMFHLDSDTSNKYDIVESFGCSKSFNKKNIIINFQDNSFIFNKDQENNLDHDIVCFMKSEKILCVSDKNTGYAMAVGFHYNSTIEYNFDCSDQETMKDALSVYVAVLDRIRTRRLLVQARQDAEARESEINEVLSNNTHRMISIIEFIKDTNLSMHYTITNTDLENIRRIKDISSSLTELRDIISITSDITSEQSSPVMLEKEWVILSDFLNSVVRNAQQISVQQDVDLRLEISNNKIYVLLDPIWMEMILNTFLTEALNNINGGGDLVVGITRLDDGSVSISIYGFSRSPIFDQVINNSGANITRGSDISASIRRLIYAHHADFIIDKSDEKSLSIHLNINKSECEDR